MNRRKLQRAVRSKAKLDSGLLDRGYHSGSYHRHFEGYKEYETVNEKGRPVLKRVYAGEWYVLDISGKKRVFLKTVYAALWLLSAVAFAFAATRRIAVNSVWYGALAELAVLAGLVWTAAGLLAYFTNPYKMTVGEWRSASWGVRRGSVFTALAFELTAILTALSALLHREWTGGSFAALGCLALSGFLMVVLDRLEANAPYKNLPNDNEIPPDAVDIG